MNKEEMRVKLAKALSDFAYAIRNESTTESEVSDLAYLLIELIETRAPKRITFRLGPR